MSERRTVLVTGGSRGLGAVLVESFLEDGENVAACSRSATPLTNGWEADVPDRFVHESLDITDRGACDGFVGRVIDRFGGIDVLVNNAGVVREGVLGLATDEDIDAVIDLNLKATLRITRTVGRRMLVSGAGRIINVTSIVGLGGYRGLSVYTTTKAGLDGLTRSLARELGPRGITVNSVAPGYMRSEMSHGLDDAQLRQIERRTPAGRLGEPADVAAAVRFLASPDAGFITGHVLVVDGGLTA